MNPSVASVKLTYDKVKGNYFSVKLRICYGNDRPRYHLPVKEGVIVKPDVYKKLVIYHQTRSERVSDEVKRVYLLVSPFIEKAQKVIDTLPVFSFSKFEQHFYNIQPATSDETCLFTWLSKLENQMNAEGRIGNADSYRAANQSLKRFVGMMTDDERIDWLGRNQTSLLPLARVTPAFLDQYEKWMLKFGKAPRQEGKPSTPASMTTIGIYLRQVRAAFNEAVKAKVITDEAYPFGRKKYVIPAGANIKKALSKSIIRQIMEYQCEADSFEERSRDLWVFSYLSNGMNLADICKLTWGQISFSDQTITFTRSKTSRTRRGNQIKVVASLFPESKAILDRWGIKDRLSSKFVFPFLTEDMDARRIKAVTKQVIKVTNKYMNKIAKSLGVEVDIKTYEARHSFASAILKGGGDVNYIKDKLGQSSLRATEAYLSSILDEDEQNVLRKSLL